MGVTAENIAAKWGISREQQDALAVESHRRAQKATEAGYFKDQIVPVMLKSKRRCGLRHRRAFPPQRHHGRHGQVEARVCQGKRHRHRGQCLGHQRRRRRRGADGSQDRPGPWIGAALARLVAYAHAGVDPKYMGIGPVPATQLALKKAGLTVNDLDVIEANEVFAAQACAVTKDLGLTRPRSTPMAPAFRWSPHWRYRRPHHGKGALRAAKRASRGAMPW